MIILIDLNKKVKLDGIFDSTFYFYRPNSAIKLQHSLGKLNIIFTRDHWIDSSELKIYRKLNLNQRKLMEILSQHLPSGGYGYPFPSVNINPMTYLEVVGYLENVPTDRLSKYLFDIKWVTADDPKINDCYIMDLDYLIFMKKIITVSKDLAMNITVECPYCHKKIEEKILINKLMFKAADDAVMEGAEIELNGSIYSIKPPTVREFEKVFENFLRYKKIDNIDTIKLISLVEEFHSNPNKVEAAVLNATHDDITMLMALKELYFDRVEPIELSCKHCKEGRYQTVRVNELIVDFFREIIKHNKLTADKIKFKQTRRI